MSVSLNGVFETWTKGPTLSMAQEGFLFIGWTINMLFIRRALIFIRRNPVVKWEFDPSGITNTRESLLLLIYIRGHKNISTVRRIQMWVFSRVYTQLTNID